MAMIVDFHTHIVPPWVQEQRSELAASDALFAELYGNSRARLATEVDLLASMDESEIQLSVALNIGWSDHEMCMRTNDYLLDASARHPDRITAFCSIQPLAGDRALREVERCAVAGARGLGELRPDVQGFSLLDRTLLFDIAGLAIQRRLVIMPHVSEPVGHNYGGKGTVSPAQLYGLAMEFPEMLIVGAHWGGGLPFYWLMPEVKAGLTNVYFDCAATHLLYEPRVYSTVAALVGPERILFGSDYPLVSQSRAVKDLRSAPEFDPQHQELMLGENALNILSHGS